MRFGGFAGLSLLLLLACSGPRAARQFVALPPPVPPAPALGQAFAFASPFVWTKEAETKILTLGGQVLAPRPFTRLEALGMDSLGIRVRCTECSEPGVGWVDSSSVVYAAPSPGEAAAGDLAGFLLAVRHAALRRDLEALRPMMAPDFTYSFGRAGGRLEALAAWEAEGFRSLDRVPAMLDGGIGSRDGRIWAAPLAFLDDPEYNDLRVGVRRVDGRWEWAFLVAGN